MIRIDYTQAALCAAALIAAIALLSQWRAFRRMREVVQRDLERIFEQVDLLRLDNQQELITDRAPTSQPVRPPAVDASLGYAAALELASAGASEAEIMTRCGLSAPEARILVAMRGMQGRARELH
jgi:hypothetical protein